MALSRITSGGTQGAHRARVPFCKRAIRVIFTILSLIVSNTEFAAASSRANDTIKSIFDVSLEAALKIQVRSSKQEFNPAPFCEFTTVSSNLNAGLDLKRASALLKDAFGLSITQNNESGGLALSLSSRGHGRSLKFGIVDGAFGKAKSLTRGHTLFTDSATHREIDHIEIVRGNGVDLFAPGEFDVVVVIVYRSASFEEVTA